MPDPSYPGVYLDIMPLSTEVSGGSYAASLVHMETQRAVFTAREPYEFTATFGYGPAGERVISALDLRVADLDCSVRRDRVAEAVMPVEIKRLKTSWERILEDD